VGIPHDNWDVIVAGAGPGGFGAAVAAARAGAKVLLIEKNPFAGGIWTTCGVSVFIDHANKAGLVGELRDRLGAAGAWDERGLKPWGSFYTVEPMKMLLDEMLSEAGVAVRLHTLLIGARRQGRRIVAVETASKSGRETFSAKLFIDGTGDGDLAALGGCGFDVGRPEDGKCQPASMFGLIGGLPEPLPDSQDARKLLREAGSDLSYHGLSFFPQPGQPGIAMLNASHLYGVDATDADSLTRAELAGRRQVHEVVRALRQSGDERFANLFVIFTGPYVGIREGRRIHGLYTVTADDCLAGRRFDDGICEATFQFDVHHVDPAEGRGVAGGKVLPYQIPYRCLLAADAENLLLCGRCISGDFRAHSSYRVTGNAVATGQATGAAAAIAALEDVAPGEVDAHRVSQITPG